MLKVFAFLSKRDDIETRAVIEHYENNHVPLVLSLAPAPAIYKRNYLIRGDELNREEDTIDFDVVTELVFPVVGQLGRRDRGHGERRRRREHGRLQAQDRRRQPGTGLVAAPVVGDPEPVREDPDLVAVRAQLDPLLDERRGCAVEAAAVAQIAIQRHAHGAPGRPVEALRRQRPQRAPLLLEALLDREAPTRVGAAVADLLAPLGVLTVELAQRAEAARRPEARLQVAHRRLNRALLARRRRRAGGGVESVVAAQVQEAPIPDDLGLLAAGDDRTHVVVDALTRHALEPLERAR